MVNAQNTKVQVAIEPQTVGTAAVSGYIDRTGFDYASVYYVGGPVATGGVPAALKIQYGDTTSVFTDFSGAVGGTDFTIPTPNTNNGDVVAFHADLRGKGPYLNLTTTGTATTRTISGVVVLSRGKVAPDTASEAGADVVVYV